MKSTPPAADGAAGETVSRRPRQSRSGPYLPSWLTRPGGAQAMAQSRCVMILSVLSGHRTVGEVIEEQKICRALYYSLENRALKGMLGALDPLRSTYASERQELTAAKRRIQALQSQLKGVTQRKRSAERLLSMVMKTARGPVTSGRRGRPPKMLSRKTTLGADSP